MSGGNRTHGKASPTLAPTITYVEPSPTASHIPPLPSPPSIRLIDIAGGAGTRSISGSISDVHVSADGRYVVFVAYWTIPQVYLYDVQQETTLIVSAAPDGSPADDWNASPSVSADGTTIVFFSYASNLTNGAYSDCPRQERCGSLYIYSIASHKLTKLSAQAGWPGGLSTALSADGRYVAYTVPWSDTAKGVFLYDLQTNTVTIISSEKLAAATRAGGVLVDISSDGRFVAFATEQDGLVSNDKNHQFDVFVFDRDTREIQRISQSMSGEDTDQPSGAQGVPNTGGAIETGLSISPDGRYIVFMSAASNLVAQSLTPCKHWPWVETVFLSCRHIYLFDRNTSTTELISVSTDGVPGNRASMGGHISGDGRWVLFSSLADNLLTGETPVCSGSGDSNFCWRVYVRDRETHQTYLVSRRANGEPASASSFDGALIGDGDFALFVSSDKGLVPGLPANPSNSIFMADLTSLLAP